jgi:opacity protein-like surface antigen
LSEEKVTVFTSITRTLLVGIVFIGIIGHAARVQAQVVISPLVGYDFGGDAGCPDLSDLIECDDRKINFGVSIGALGTLFGLEGEVAYAPDFFGESTDLSSSVLTGMANILFVPKLGPVRPYVTAGLGVIKTNVELTADSVFTTNDNTFGWNIGGGVIGFVSDHVGLRGDLRYFHAFQDLSALGFTLEGSKLDYGRASVGVVLAF